MARRGAYVQHPWCSLILRSRVLHLCFGRRGLDSSNKRFPRGINFHIWGVLIFMQKGGGADAIFKWQSGRPDRCVASPLGDEKCHTDHMGREKCFHWLNSLFVWRNVISGCVMARPGMSLTGGVAPYGAKQASPVEVLDALQAVWKVLTQTTWQHCNCPPS